jgi:hypothetical protein
MKTSREKEVSKSKLPSSSNVNSLLQDREEKRFLDVTNVASHPLVHLKFDLRLESIKELSSIMKMVIDKISSLKLDSPIESCHLNLHPLPPLGMKKMANLDICVNGDQFVTECGSSRWDNAFLNAFDHFRTQVKS